MGQQREAMVAASQHQLDRLTVIVDRKRLLEVSSTVHFRPGKPTFVIAHRTTDIPSRT